MHPWPSPSTFCKADFTPNTKLLITASRYLQRPVEKVFIFE